MKKCLPLIAVLLVSSLGAQSSEWTTVFVVRHAEKEAGEDPGLTPVGLDRARRLEALLADAGIDALFSSQYRRTRETLAPLAKAHDLRVRVVPAQDPRALIDTILTQYRGRQVVVASHSNLVPELVRLLGADEPPPIDESEYFHLYAVVVAPDGGATAVRLKY